MVSELQKEKNFWKFYAKNSMNGEVAIWDFLYEIKREVKNLDNLIKTMMDVQEKKIKQNEVFTKQILPLLKGVKKDLFKELNAGGKNGKERTKRTNNKSR